MNTVIVAIGSNLEPEKNIPAMLDLLRKEVEVIQVSELLKTKPIGIEDQPDFVNGAVKIKTGMSQIELKAFLKKLEDELGRDRSAPKFGSRTIDLDILIFNDEVVDPDYHTREFLRKSAKELGFRL